MLQNGFLIVLLVFQLILGYSRHSNYQERTTDSVALYLSKSRTAVYGLAEVYFSEGDLGVAEEHGQKALKFAREAQSIWDLERNSKILSHIDAKAGDKAQAHDYLELNQEYKDSLYNREKLQAVSLLQLENQEAENQEAVNQRLLSENDLAEKQLFINKMLILFLISVSIFLILLVVLFRRNSLQKEKFNKELEEKNKTISEKNRLILARNKDLAEIDKAKNRLFSILSHDLKSPIGSIQQLLEMMKSEDFTPEEQANLLDEMLKQITATSFMLHNLLHWAESQLEGNRTSLEPLSPAPEVERVLDAHYWPAKRKDISIIHGAKDNLPRIVADKDQLSVILHNLISNAIKFTPEGGAIEIHYNRLAGKLQISIKDEGEGIPPEKIAQIRNLSSRMISGLGTDLETGTGLGLLLVKDFLKVNNAELDIFSGKGKGSEFRMSFPIDFG